MTVNQPDDRTEDYRRGYADGRAAALKPLRGPRDYTEQRALLDASLDNIEPLIHFFEPPEADADHPRPCVHCGVLRNDHPRPNVADLLAERDALAGAASDGVCCGSCGLLLPDDRGLYKGSAAYHEECARQVYGDPPRDVETLAARPSGATSPVAGDVLREASRDYREHVHDLHPPDYEGTGDEARAGADAACAWLEQRADLMGGNR